MTEVLAALSTLRLARCGDELHYLQPEIGAALKRAGIAHHREVRIAPRCRVDFLTQSGVVVEVKRGRPRMAALMCQMTKYASCEGVRSIVLVLERSVPLAPTILEKPACVLSLHALWGPAV